MSNDDSSWSLTDQPFAYAIFPLVCLVIGIFIASVLYSRRRRRRIAAVQNGQWPQDPNAPPNGTGRQRRNRGAGNRWAPWSGTRTEEGLNELGEAPPPYDGKRDENERGAAAADDFELRDLEANRPPEYPAQPGPAVTRNSTLPSYA
jgi:hypothetical protein